MLDICLLVFIDHGIHSALAGAVPSSYDHRCHQVVIPESFSQEFIPFATSTTRKATALPFSIVEYAPEYALVLRQSTWLGVVDRALL